MTKAKRAENWRRVGQLGVVIGRMQTGRLYYVLSLKERDLDTEILTFWRPNASGYCYRLEDAGRYMASEIEAHRSYYDNGESTRAIPCDVVEALAVQVSQVETRELEGGRCPNDRVVERTHFAKLRGPKPKKKAMPASQEARSA